jgi:hypothetical protein
MLMRPATTVGFQQTLPLISQYSSVESRQGNAPEDEKLDDPTEGFGWKIGVPVGYTYDVVAKR